MKLVPQSLSRLGHRSLLKLNASSPTILVVSGVIGFGVTAVMAAKATRKIDPVIEDHQKGRFALAETFSNDDKTVTSYSGRELTRLYLGTGMKLARIYGPTLAVGTLSAAAVLSGHRILKGRHVATMMAYTGLQEQFAAYRKRIVKTIGEEAEKDIYDGAHGEYTEDPDHKGEFKMGPKWDEDESKSYLRPWFDEGNYNWTRTDMGNYYFLKGVQSHANHLLVSHGHLFLNEVLDALHMPRCPQGQVMGWVYHKDGINESGDNFVDFGFMTSNDPHTIAFRNGSEKTVRLNFNVDDDPIWLQI